MPTPHTPLTANCFTARSIPVMWPAMSGPIKKTDSPGPTLPWASERGQTFMCSALPSISAYSLVKPVLERYTITIMTPP